MNLPSLRRSLVSPLVPMGAVLALVGLTSLAHGAPIQRNGGENGAHEADVDYRRIAANFARKTAKLPETLAAIPRLSLDPAAVVAVVGTDPTTLTEWVSSETRWVPYRGILRGPVGVLMDRRGNTADRALLLMELFHAAGHTPTLHRGSLNERTAATLFAALLTVDPGGTDLGAAPAPTGDALEALARRMGTTSAELSTELLSAQSQAQSAAEHGIGEVMVQSGELGSFVNAELAMAARATERAEAVATLRDHFWVTLEVDGETQRFDPLLPTQASPAGELEPAQPPGSEASYGYDQKQDLPGELYHTLTVRFEVERTDGGRIERNTALSHSIRPYELGAYSLMLACEPLGYVSPPDSELAGLDPARRAARERASLLEVKEWLPRIVVQGRLFEDKSFRADGSLNDSPQKGQGREGSFYWRLDPATGEALGMGPDGWGQSSAETLVQLQLAAIFIEMFRCSRQPRAERPQCLAGAICAYVGLAVGVLSMNPIAGFGAGTLCTYATR